MAEQMTYDVRIWKTSVYKGKQKTTHTVRWVVDGNYFSEPFGTAALAESFRAELVTATRKGEAFSTETGRPVSARAKAGAVSWYDFAIRYVDAKWPKASANNRKNIAKALVPVTVAMFRGSTSPDGQVMRTALREWGFNREQRAAAPSESAKALRWAARHSRPVSALNDTETLARVLDALSTKLDGKAVASSSVKRNRRVLHNALEYAVQVGCLTTNPLKGAKLTPARSSTAVDKRCLVSATQTAALLGWVGAQPRGGGRLRPFFAAIRYAGLRPEEAVALRVHDVTLPESGWGEILAHRATPEVGRRWTDTGEVRDVRHLKGRDASETRPVPCHPRLAAILREHIASEGLRASDLLFQGEGGGALSGSVYRRAWRGARKAVLSPHDFDSPLGKRVYDLRHTCLTEWLNAGVPPAQVATWAGNSVAVLLATYALCITGQEDDLKRRIESALPHA
jgi:integrase